MKTCLKLITFSFLLFAFTFILASRANAIYCDPPLSGNWTISTACVIYEDVNGTALGDVTIQSGVTLTLHAGKTLVWYPGQKITIPAGANIIVNNTGKIRQAFICTQESGTATGYAVANTSSNPDGGTLYLGMNQVVSTTSTDTITDPVAWWKFDDNTGTSAVDSSGNGITATLVNTPTWVTGKLGYAVSLTAASLQYATATNALLNNITGAFTLSAWVYRTAGGNTEVISKIGAVGTGGYAMLIGNLGEVYCRTDNGSGFQDSYTITGKVPASTWTHLAVVRNGTSCRVYINGTDSTNTAASHTLSGNTNALNIGARSGAPQEYFPGRIDDVRVYNRNLSASEISTMYNRNCAAGFKRREDFLSKDLVDTGTTGTTGALAIVYRYLLNLGMAIYNNATGAEITPKPTGTGNPVAILGGNLQVCTGATCTLSTPADFGNVIIENKLGIGIGTPGSLLDVQGDAEFGANNLLITGTNTANPYIDLAVGDTGSGVGYGRGIILRRGRTGTGASNWANIGLINDTTLGIGMLQSVGTATGIMTINSSGQVGIGNTSPAQLLQVGNGTYPVTTLPGINVAANGASYVTVSDNTRQVFLSADSSGYGFTGTYSNHDFIIRTNTSEKARVAANGNVSIGGIAVPTAKLDISGYIKTLGSSTFAQSDNTNTGYGYAPIQLREAQYGATAGYLAPRLAFHRSGSAAQAQISIESGGRLTVLNGDGTGYANLISGIHYANSSFRVANDVSTIMDGNQFYCNNAGNCHFNYSGTGTTNFSSSQNTIIGTGGGKLGVGVVPTYKLDVTGNANITGGLDMSQNTRLTIGSKAYLSSGGNYVHLATNEYYNGSAWVGSGAGLLFQINGATGAGIYYASSPGVHTAWASITGTGGWTAGSSRQFKQNIQELTEADYQKLREQFLATSLFSYNRKDKPKEPEVGFIAEEAPDYILNGSDKTQVTLMKGVGYLATITKGQGQEIVDQQEQIESLEKIIKKLQNEINSLKESTQK